MSLLERLDAVAKRDDVDDFEIVFDDSDNTWKIDAVVAEEYLGTEWQNTLEDAANAFIALVDDQSDTDIQQRG